MNETNRIDVLSLEDFRSTLDGRLSEANSVRTCLTELLRRTDPELGDLPDAQHVDLRYRSLYDQHLNRIGLLIDAITATRAALTTIIDNYQTTEARLTANAKDIADALGAVSGVPDGQTSRA